MRRFIIVAYVLCFCFGAHLLLRGAIAQSSARIYLPLVWGGNGTPAPTTPTATSTATTTPATATPTRTATATRTVTPTPGNIRLTIETPSAGAVISDTLEIVVRATSVYELPEVVASVEGRTTTLVSNGSRWTGTLDLDGLPRGEYTLIVSTTDVRGESAEARQQFRIDRPPTLTMSEPIPYTVALPAIPLQVTCTDDDPAGCQTINVYIARPSETCLGNTLLATGTSAINTTVVPEPRYREREVRVCAEAIDTAGYRVTVAARPIFVETTTQLQEVERVGGEILDVLDDRVLYIVRTGSDNELRVYDRETQADTLVVQDQEIYSGQLTPVGALYVLTERGLRPELYDWRPDQVFDVGRLGSYDVKVAGTYALYIANRDNFDRLERRELVSLSNATVLQSRLVARLSWDVAANGDVVYDSINPSGVVSRYRNGVVTRLSPDDGTSSFRPLTDGQLVVYTKYPAGGGSGSLILNIDGVEQTLSSQSFGGSAGSYQIDNGWVAFVQTGSSGIQQVWRRSPAGEIEQVSFFGVSSTIESLAPNGDIVFRNDNGYYLARANETPVALDFKPQRLFWQDDQWYVTIGRSLFELDLDE